MFARETSALRCEDTTENVVFTVSHFLPKPGEADGSKARGDSEGYRGGVGGQDSHVWLPTLLFAHSDLQHVPTSISLDL